VRKYLIAALTGLLIGMGISLSYGQGPLTNALNLRVRTDANGYLIITSAAYSASDGPLTNFGNIRLRTDSNGYLLTTFGAAAISIGGSLQLSDATAAIYWAGRAVMRSPANGIWTLANSAETIGIELKADALPTVASGFGTSPAVTAGSTPLAGSINVGTGAPGTGGVINFNGTAFPSAPFVVCMDDSSLLTIRCTTTTTQMTIAATALTAGDVVSWIAISSK
jgi:hypothetical protein